MRVMLTIYGFLLSASLSQAQVCCSPSGSALGGGGAGMNNWKSHWPSIYAENKSWQWLFNSVAHARGPAGNIAYGPQLSIQNELSKTINSRFLFYLGFGGELGSIQENISFARNKTKFLSSSFYPGIRLSIGSSGMTWFQSRLIFPAPIYFDNINFPFQTQEAITGEILVLHQQPTPWSKVFPGILDMLMLNLVLQKKMQAVDDLVRDVTLTFHTAFPLQNWYPLFAAPFLHFYSERLLIPPTFDTGSHEARQLSTLYFGVDLSFDYKYSEPFQIRLAFPTHIWSDSPAGFPDGTTPSSNIQLSFNWTRAIN